MEQEARRFLDEFEAALDRGGNPAEAKTARQASRIVDRLVQQLTELGTEAYGEELDQLRRLQERLKVEVAELPALRPMVEKAKALSRLEGILSDPLRHRAEELAARAPKLRTPRGATGKGEIPDPVIVICEVCDEQVVGHNQGPASRWGYVRQRAKAHAQKIHPEKSAELGKQLRSSLGELRKGLEETKAGPFVIRVERVD